MDDNNTYVPYQILDPNPAAITATAVTVALALIGNLMVIIVKMIRKDLRSNVAAYYITSLAISDLLISSIYAPSILIQFMHFNTWVLGPVMCKLFMFTRNLVICVSVLTLTAIAFDRYQVICKPFHFISTTRRTRITITLIWIAGIGICLPNLFLVELKTINNFNLIIHVCQRYDDSKKIFSRTYTLLTVFILYIVPSTFMLLYYVSIFQHLTQNNNAVPGSIAVPSRLMKERKKVAKTMLLVSLFFVVCWGCYWSYIIWYRFHESHFTQRTRYNNFWLSWLPTLSSAVNPIIYAFSGQLFRRRQPHPSISKSRSFTARSNTFNTTRADAAI